MNDKLGRREFLKHGAAVAAFPAGLASAAARKDSQIDRTGAIPTRVLGKTKVTLPILGYGGAALPKVWGNPLSFDDRVKLVRYAYDRGIRYYDTAGNYMESQGKKSLKELQTDYLDAVLIHGTPGLEQMSVERAMKIHSALVKLRDERLFQSIGLSAHSYFDKALALISSGGFDLCMLSYGYIPRGHNQIFSARMLELRNACVAKAHELDIGLVAMKVMGAGVLGAWSGYVVPRFERKRREGLPAAAMRYVLDDERIHILNIGMRLQEEVKANIKTLSGDLTYTVDDRAGLADFSAKVFESDAIKKMRVD